MKLSIITVNYNDAEGLRKTFASVSAQTYHNIEHVIVDAASTDDSVDIIKEYVANAVYPVIWSSEKDKGVYDGMNKGIRKATGDYIQILNSGDILAAPDVSERMVSALPEGTAILYGNMIKNFGNGKKVLRDNCGGAGATESFLYFYKGTLNHDSAYIRRDLFDKYGFYNEGLKICSDWEWYVKAIALGGEKAVYTNIDVTIFDMGGISETNIDLRKKERRQVLESLVPCSILFDYDKHAFDMEQMTRLRRHHLYGLVYFLERVLFKLEKWKFLR